MQIFFANCTDLLIRAQEKETDDLFLVRIAFMRTLLIELVKLKHINVYIRLLDQFFEILLLVLMTSH